jgi:hypothetical protein
MRWINATLFALALAAGTASCATAPTTAEAQAADYGPLVAQERAQALAEDYLRTILRDPESARFTWKPLERGWREGSGSKPIIYGYLLEGTVNAKNAFGGYTGPTAYSLLFRGETIMAVYAERHTNGIPHMVQIL